MNNAINGASTIASQDALASEKPINSPVKVITASLIGTTIEFFDFYIYATAAVLVFPSLFFPNDDPTSALLASFATFSIAFFARPLGAILFGHYGDRIGRKTTLVIALLTMGLSTVVIGFLPSYAQVGIWAPLLLALCRFGQGLGLGGEWGGAVLLATENAPKGKKSWYGMFPQIGAPLGLILASGLFFLLLHFMSKEALLAWGWRVPFISSTALIIIGLWVRLSIHETPAFQKAIDNQERVKVPFVEVIKNHKKTIFLCTFMTLITFVLFHLCASYLLSYNIKVRGMNLLSALEVQMFGALVFSISIPLSAKIAEKCNRYWVLLGVTIAIAIFALFTEPLLTGPVAFIYLFIAIGMFLEGITYGVIGAALATAFPTHVRYTGCSITFNLGGVFGASLAPYIATWLQTHYGLSAIAYYLIGSCVITALCIIGMGQKKL